MIWVFLFICLLESFFETESHSEAHAGLEFSMKHRLALNLWRSSWLNFQSAGVQTCMWLLSSALRALLSGISHPQSSLVRLFFSLWFSVWAILLTCLQAQRLLPQPYPSSSAMFSNVSFSVAACLAFGVLFCFCIKCLLSLLASISSNGVLCIYPLHRLHI